MHTYIYHQIHDQAKRLDDQLIAYLGRGGVYEAYDKAWLLTALGDYDDADYEAAITFDTGDTDLDRALSNYADVAASLHFQCSRNGDQFDDHAWELAIRSLVFLSELAGRISAMIEDRARRKAKGAKSVGKRWDNDPKTTFVKPIAKSICDAWAADPSLYRSETAVLVAIHDKAYPHTLTINTFRKWRKEWKATE